MQYLSFIGLILMMLLLQACEPDVEVQPKPYPYVLTKEVRAGADGASFSAELLGLGDHKILAYGFVWSDHESPTESDNKKVYQQGVKEGLYTYKLESGLFTGKTYFVRAYVETERHKVYGNEVSFTSQGSKQPKISGFTPASGPIGSRVEISGEYFVPSVSGNIVKFGHLTAVVDSATENKLYVRVPQVSKHESVRIAVETAGYVSTSRDEFKIWFPWQRKADHPGHQVLYGTSFALNGKIYTCGGLQYSNFVPFNEFWEYDPATDTWTRKPDFPGEARVGATAFSINGKAYYGLGSDYLEKEYFTDLWEYDPVRESWTWINIYPGTPVMQQKSFVLNNKAYMGTGEYRSKWGNLSYTNEFWEYDPLVNRWQQKKSFPGAPRIAGMAIATNDKGYMGIGGTGWRMTNIYEYDPQTDTWSEAGTYPGKGFRDVASFYINNKLYMGLGGDNSGYTCSDFWEYSPDTKSWKEMREAPSRIRPYISVTVGDKGYAGYGFYEMYERDEAKAKVFFEFDPAKN